MLKHDLRTVMLKHNLRTTNYELNSLRSSGFATDVRNSVPKPELGNEKNEKTALEEAHALPS